MALYAGDKAPKAISVPIATGSVDGTTVDSVRLMVRRPDGSAAELTVALGAKTTTSVQTNGTLAADGSTLPVGGQYLIRAWGYAVGGALLFDSDESSFHVRPALVASPE